MTIIAGNTGDTQIYEQPEVISILLMLYHLLAQKVK